MTTDFENLFGGKYNLPEGKRLVLKLEDQLAVVEAVVEAVAVAEVEVEAVVEAEAEAEVEVEVGAGACLVWGEP